MMGMQKVFAGMSGAHLNGKSDIENRVTGRAYEKPLGDIALFLEH